MSKLSRYYYNKEILKTLNKQFKKAPDIRFEQHLLNTFGPLSYYRESVETLNHLKYSSESLCAKHAINCKQNNVYLDSHNCLECSWVLKMYRKIIWKLFKI